VLARVVSRCSPPISVACDLIERYLLDPCLLTVVSVQAFLLQLLKCFALLRGGHEPSAASGDILFMPGKFVQGEPPRLFHALKVGLMVTELGAGCIELRAPGVGDSRLRPSQLLTTLLAPHQGTCELHLGLLFATLAQCANALEAETI